MTRAFGSLQTHRASARRMETSRVLSMSGPEPICHNLYESTAKFEPPLLHETHGRLQIDLPHSLHVIMRASSQPEQPAPQSSGKKFLQSGSSHRTQGDLTDVWAREDTSLHVHVTPYEFHVLG
eukprot:3925310-Amphidinium_carterae.2